MIINLKLLIKNKLNSLFWEKYHKRQKFPIRKLRHLWVIYETEKLQNIKEKE